MPHAVPQFTEIHGAFAMAPATAAAAQQAATSTGAAMAGLSDVQPQVGRGPDAATVLLLVPAGSAGVASEVQTHTVNRGGRVNAAHRWMCAYPC
jgi:hypothetical protein